MDGDGFSIKFEGCDDSADDTEEGSTLQNSTIENLANNDDYAIVVDNCNVNILNSKLSSNESGPSTLHFSTPKRVRIEDNEISRLGFYFKGLGFSMVGSSSSIKDNHFLDTRVQTFYIYNYTSVPFSEGQITGNHFQGGVPITLSAYDNSGVSPGTLPFESNYWAGGLPSVNGGSYGPSDYDFSPALDSAPASAGPDW
jgi:hypothetical protein